MRYNAFLPTSPIMMYVLPRKPNFGMSFISSRRFARVSARLQTVVPDESPTIGVYGKGKRRPQGRRMPEGCSYALATRRRDDHW